MAQNEEEKAFVDGLRKDIEDKQNVSESVKAWIDNKDKEPNIGKELNGKNPSSKNKLSGKEI